jgi:predicted nucleic acid-binding protein
MPKVVIDANVIVSAMFGGTPRKAFLKALRTCDVYVSPEMSLSHMSNGIAG